jgi:positive regulator of sigma E activity
VAKIDEIEKLKKSIEAKQKELIVESSPQANMEVTQNVDDGLILSSILLFFTLLVFLIMYQLIKLGKNPGDILKTFGTIFIIVAAVFLIVAGYSEEQISPVIGLLGTVAGYILGRNSSRETALPPIEQPKIK